VQNALGEHTSQMYIQAKRKEWQEYTSQVTKWELDEYLYKI
jgi:glutamine synthetase